MLGGGERKEKKEKEKEKKNEKETKTEEKKQENKNDDEEEGYEDGGGWVSLRGGKFRKLGDLKTGVRSMVWSGELQ